MSQRLGFRCNYLDTDTHFAYSNIAIGITDLGYRIRGTGFKYHGNGSNIRTIIHFI